MLVATSRSKARERILYVFEQVESQAGAPEFRGCRYLAVQIELKDQSHPASRVAHRVKATHVKSQASGLRDGLGSVRDRGHHLHVRLGVHDHLEAGAYHLLVVGDQNPHSHGSNSKDQPFGR
ncbi:hypothetical protein [Nonomuraea sp. NPDC050691]|uniref:hypothetical protein n=1 Tax=Nonomuraea sp. NPDC050691 TaxID=3155661 RepID=UPI00340C0804